MTVNLEIRKSQDLRKLMTGLIMIKRWLEHYSYSVARAARDLCRSTTTQPDPGAS
jgi:hypothetical protein